ncbi:MAG TPA: ammonia-forming cytochrome c nitrite reductase subunit c552, partial [Pyrinomonadaceae bacterium]|nr:ammonia-forming cytochrome c nitrite reductase subunit c552 [Pyrinomonadaceae bacterium]
MADEEKEKVEKERRPRARGVKLVVLTALITLLAAVAGVALLVNILQHKEEARNPFYRVVELTDETEDPAVWGKNFPQQYDAYLRTVDQVRTRYGGSEALPHTPTEADPRTVVAQSRLEEDPRLRQMWAGYAFSRDFREERGHAYMLDDQTFTKRQAFAKQPGTCMNCHASVYTTYKQLGGGDIFKGF